MAHTLEELKEINRVFVRVTADPQLPIQYGLLQREAMMRDLKKGKIPQGDRYPFMLKTAQKVIILMGQLAEMYDDKHPGDRMSVEDLKDVLKYALRQLDKKSS